MEIIVRFYRWYDRLDSIVPGLRFVVFMLLAMPWMLCLVFGTPWMIFLGGLWVLFLGISRVWYLEWRD